MSRDQLRQWHRLFGIALTDLFSDSLWRVELEKELALQSQLLDVVIIERTGGGTADPAALGLPDGLEGLRSHNLLTYKSRHEPLDAWALEELIGHYVNYRKLLAAAPAGQEAAGPRPRRGKLLPEADFQLYAVTTRAPRKLGRHAALEEVASGVFNLHWGSRIIRLIMLGDIAAHPRNAPWELFSTRMELLRHGAEHYQAHRPEAATLIYELYLRYQLETSNMAYTLEDFFRESSRTLLSRMSPQDRQNVLDSLPEEERLRGVSVETRLRGLSAEERLRGLAAEERLRGLAEEERLRGVSAEARLRGVSAEARLRGLSEEERLRGMSAEERLRGLSDEELARIGKLIEERHKH